MRSLLLALGLTIAANNVYSFVLEAQFTDTSDVPITSVADVKLKLYNPSKTCLLFEEDFNPDLSSTNGKVSLELGTGTLVYLDVGYTSPTEVLINNGQLNGQAACSYTPGANDGRILEVSFDDGTNGLQLLGDVSINPAPQATFASQSGTAGGLILNNGGFTTTFQTQASGDYFLDFPADAGAPGQIMVTDGAGMLSWMEDKSAETQCTGLQYLAGDGTCQTPSAGGLSSLNGLTGAAQTFNTGTAGTSPTFNSSGVIHTLDIPLASTASVTSGTISNADYVNFSNKQNPIPNTDALTEGSTNLYFTNTRAKTAAVINTTAGAETDQAASVAALKTYVSATSGYADIAANSITSAMLGSMGATNGQVLIYDGSNWAPGTPAGGGDVLVGGNTLGAPMTIGTNDGFPLNLEANSNSAITILANGRVGIGTPAPPKMFSVITDDVSLIQKNNPGTGIVNVLDLVASNSVGPGAALMGPSLSFTGETSTEGTFKQLVELEARWDDPNDATASSDLRIRLSDSGTLVPKFIIKPNGNVGIDDMAPTTKLSVQGTIKIGNGAESCISAIDEGMLRTNTGFLEYCNGSSWQVIGSGGTGDINNGGNAFATDLTLGTTDSHSLILKTGNTDRVFILPTGNIGVDTNSPTEKLHIVGNLRVQGATDCTLGSGSGATNCTSDERMKDEITPIPNALEKIKAIKGVEFVWNELARSPGRNDIGVIAQDIQKVFPTAVIENAEGYLSVDYAVLVAPLIESVKDLDEKNRELMTENEEIKQELADIKSLVCSLKPEAAVCQ